MATLQTEPKKEPIPVAKYEIRNSNIAQPLVRKYPDKEVPYPSNEAVEVADRIFKKENRIELENVLFDIEDAKNNNQREVKIRGDLSDRTHHALSQMRGFQIKTGYEEKPKHMQNGNTETFDINRPYTIISWY